MAKDKKKASKKSQARSADACDDGYVSAEDEDYDPLKDKSAPKDERQELDANAGFGIPGASSAALLIAQQRSVKQQLAERRKAGYVDSVWTKLKEATRAPTPVMHIPSFQQRAAMPRAVVVRGSGTFQTPTTTTATTTATAQAATTAAPESAEAALATLSHTQTFDGKDEQSVHSSRVSAAADALAVAREAALAAMPRAGLVRVTEQRNFAGKTVEVARTVKAGSKAHAAAEKRKAATGVDAVLGALEKKQKVTVTEKSRADWETHKEKADLTEELEKHKRSGGAYLAQQDFLKRTELRQWEKGKSTAAQAAPAATAPRAR
ncbi:BCNT-C domain-containing protein [Pseudoscourfieldia marina]